MALIIIINQRQCLLDFSLLCAREMKLDCMIKTRGRERNGNKWQEKKIIDYGFIVL